MPPVERDPFWEERAGERMPRYPRDRFFGTRRPPPEPPALLATSSPAWRFALTLLGCGFLGALLYQIGNESHLIPLFLATLIPGLDILASLVLMLQAVSLVQSFFAILALGAPLFEEFLKVGAALALCIPLARYAHGPARPFVVAVRMLAATGTGALFGWSEHFLYSEEDDLSYLFRVVFHAGSSALSMATYCVLEVLPDPRTRWFSTAPASLLHYANNGYVLFFALLGGETAATVWSFAIAGATVVAIPAVMAASSPLRRLAMRRVAHWFGPLRHPPAPSG